MRVLAATHETQGEVEGDFSFCIEGELVRLPIVICRSGDQCGCARAFDGVASHKATTTAKVVERPELDPDLYPELLYADLAEWVDDVDDPELVEWQYEQAAFLARAAECFALGTVVTAERDAISARKHGVGSSPLLDLLRPDDGPTD